MVSNYQRVHECVPYSSATPLEHSANCVPLGAFSIIADFVVGVLGARGFLNRILRIVVGVCPLLVLSVLPGVQGISLFS